MKNYRIYCNGYEKNTTNFAEVQPYIEWLRANNCVGKEVVISIGDRLGNAVSYEIGYKERRSILSAA